MARKRVKQTITVVPGKPHEIGVRLAFKFNELEIGAERTNRIYTGIALIVGGLFEGDEITAFMAKMDKAKKVAAQTGKRATA
ncbi:MAG: hypothetical protein LLG20_18340 [Acidobacteriales bacterium]|nr:hypothetical protein [Terriglobales bacterium]